MKKIKNTHTSRPSMLGRPRRTAVGALAACAALAYLPGAGAQAAQAHLPVVTTGSAAAVSYGSATLTGRINPEGSTTSYYFQYGPTRAYGLQTAILSAPAGAPVRVSVPVSGLQPLSVYRYRLVAVNATGVADGVLRTFRTAKVPLSLAVLASPNPVAYGGGLTVQGTLSGSENAGRPVTLEANSFPFTTGFAPVGNPELTTAQGAFSFVVPALGITTQFRVSTLTDPAVLSPVATENVSVRVSSHLGRARRPHRVRVYGTVTPAESGFVVQIMHTLHGRERVVGNAVLHGSSGGVSHFSVAVGLSRGIYTVRALVSGAQSSGEGRPLLVR